jgi:hypothetical protein
MASSIRQKYSAGPNFSANSVSGSENSVMPMTPIVPAMNEPIAAIASADQDRSRRAAITRAVVEAGHQDDRRRRVHAVGDRNQQRDAGGRPDAGQHADDGAEQHADERVEQVDRLQADRKTLEKVADALHRARAGVRRAPARRRGRA